MSFFKDLTALGTPREYALSISISAEDKMQATIRVMPTGANGKEVTALVPLIFKGTPAGFDEELIQAMKTPLEKTSEFFANRKEFEESLAAADKKDKEDRSQKQKKTSTAATSTAASSAPAPKPVVDKEKAAKRKKFDAQMEKVAVLESAGKIGQAIGQLPNAKDYPDFVEKIQTKLKLLKNKHVGYNMFEVEEPTASPENGGSEVGTGTEDPNGHTDPQAPDEPEDPKAAVVNPDEGSGQGGKKAKGQPSSKKKARNTQVKEEPVH